jgi:hypothetical protein
LETDTGGSVRARQLDAVRRAADPLVRRAVGHGHDLPRAVGGDVRQVIDGERPRVVAAEVDRGEAGLECLAPVCGCCSRRQATVSARRRPCTSMKCSVVDMDGCMPADVPRVQASRSTGLRSGTEWPASPAGSGGMARATLPSR